MERHNKPTTVELDAMSHAEFKRRFMTPILLTHVYIDDRRETVSVEEEGDRSYVALEHRDLRTMPSELPFIRTWSAATRPVKS